jgi:predicted glycosyltransferase
LLLLVQALDGSVDIGKVPFHRILPVLKDLLGEAIERVVVRFEVKLPVRLEKAPVFLQERGSCQTLLGPLLLRLGVGECEPYPVHFIPTEERIDEFDTGAQEANVIEPFLEGLFRPGPDAIPFDVDPEEIGVGIAAGQFNGILALSTGQLQIERTRMGKEGVLPTPSELVPTLKEFFQIGLENVLEAPYFLEFRQFTFPHFSGLDPCKINYLGALSQAPECELMADKKRILVAPLDWGLGHATRCIPIIRSLKELGAEVLIGTSDKALSLLRREFPDLPYVEMPSYKVDYPKDGNMAFHMFRLAPRIRKAIKKEHKELERLVREQKLDGVISDNRLGLSNKRVPTVLITHQLFIRTPRFRWAVDRLNRHYISRFDECWIPDEADVHENLSGALSHGTELPQGLSFIGPLSRFWKSEEANEEEASDVPKRDPRIVGLVSGPEPQRGMFADIVNEELKDRDLRATLVTGLPQKKGRKKETTRISEFDHLPTEELQKAIEEADLVISRSGYSTIMDLAALGKKAVLVPTPGQSEQEYLALYHDKKDHFPSFKQDDFDLGQALERIDRYRGVHLPPRHEDLKERLAEFLGVGAPSSP